MVPDLFIPHNFRVPHSAFINDQAGEIFDATKEVFDRVTEKHDRANFVEDS